MVLWISCTLLLLLRFCDAGKCSILGISFLALSYPRGFSILICITLCDRIAFHFQEIGGIRWDIAEVILATSQFGLPVSSVRVCGCVV